MMKSQQLNSKLCFGPHQLLKEISGSLTAERSTVLPSSSLNSLPFDAGQVVKIGFIRWEQLPHSF